MNRHTVIDRDRINGEQLRKINRPITRAQRIGRTAMALLAPFGAWKVSEVAVNALANKSDEVKPAVLLVPVKADEYGEGLLDMIWEKFPNADTNTAYAINDRTVEARRLAGERSPKKVGYLEEVNLVVEESEAERLGYNPTADSEDSDAE